MEHLQVQLVLAKQVSASAKVECEIYDMLAEFEIVLFNTKKRLRDCGKTKISFLEDGKFYLLETNFTFVFLNPFFVFSSYLYNSCCSNYMNFAFLLA